MSNSRLCVKNLPKYVTEDRLKEHFAACGQVTDCKISRTKDGESRRFGYVGYKHGEEAVKAMSFFNKSFLDTCRLTVEPAIEMDAVKPRPWSRHSKGSSAFDRSHPGSVAAEKRKRDSASHPSADESANPVSDEALDAFLSASKGGKRKAWESGLLPEVEAREKKAKGEPKTRLMDNDDADEEEAGNDDGLALDNTVSDMDYFKARMAKEDDNASENTETADGPPMEDDGPAGGANNARLFVLNVPYTVTEDELIAHFSPYGALDDVHIPIDATTHRPRGFAFVTFVAPLQAAQAQVATNNRNFQGRLLRVTMADEAVGDGEGATKRKEARKAPGEYAEQKKAKLRREKTNAAAWATLFVRGDTAAAATAERMGVDKATLMTEGSAGDAAVRLALGETQTIQETRAYFEEHGVRVEPPGGPFVRSRKVLVVKNLAHTANKAELEALFARYGDVAQMLMPPSRAVAIVEFFEVNHAKAAFAGLAYAPFAGAPLFLEWAPEGLVKESEREPEEEKPVLPVVETRAHVVDDVDDDPLQELQSKTLYVTNLNFATTKADLQKWLQKKLGRESIRSVTIATGTKARSGGYGFIECLSSAFVLKAYKTLQGEVLDGHALKFQLSKAKVAKEAKTKKDKKREKTREKKEDAFVATSSKLAVKNIAFEADRKELRALFAAFGDVQNLRLPQKPDGTSRGFCFVTFATKTEAQAAADALKHTHFYGRHLVIENANE